MMRWVWSDSDKEWWSQKPTQNCSATQKWTLKVVTMQCQTSSSNIEFFTCLDAVLMTQLLLKILSAALLLSRLAVLSVSSGPRCHCSYQCLPRLNSNAAWSTQDQASPTDNLIILVSLPGAQTDRWGQCWLAAVLLSSLLARWARSAAASALSSDKTLRRRSELGTGAGRQFIWVREENTGCSQHSGFRIRGLIWVFRIQQLGL